MVDFGSKLRALRKESGMTQTELAQRLNITKAVVSYYEKLERTPSPDVLIRLADIFNVTTDYLLGRTSTVNAIDVSGLNEEEIILIQSMIEYFRKHQK